MKIYDFEYDGKRYTIEGPDDATPEQLISFVTDSAGTEEVTPPESAAPQPPLPQRVKTSTQQAVERGLLPRALHIPLESIENAGRKASNALTFGFSDEIEGAKEAAKELIVGGGADKARERYAQVRDRERALLAQYAQDYPAASGLAGLGGSLLLPGASGVKAAKLASSNIGGRIFAGTGAGGVAGALTGAGESEAKSVGGVAVDTGYGGAVGALLGGALPAVTSTAKALYSGAKDLIAPATGAAARTQAERIAADTLSRVEGGIEGVRARATQAVPEAILADVGGERAQRALAAARQKAGAASETQIQKIVERQQDAPNRISTYVRRALGPPIDSLEAFAATKATKLQDAQKAYSLAYSHGPVQSKAVADLISDPNVRPFLATAHKEAQKADALRQKVLPDLFDANGALVRAPDVRDLHRTVELLDSEVGRQFQSGSRDIATALKDVKNTLKASLREEVPAYNAASKKYLEASRVQDLLEEGAKFTNPTVTVNALKAIVKDLSPTELKAYRGSAVNKIIEKISNASDTSKAYALLLNNKTMREKLKILGADKAPNVERLFRQLKDERNIHSTYSRLTQGSPTQDKLVAAEELGDSVARHVATNGLSVSSALQAGIGSIVNRARGVPEEVADQLTAIYATPRSRVETVLQALQANAQRQNAAAQRSTQNSAALGAFAGQQGASASNPNFQR